MGVEGDEARNGGLTDRGVLCFCNRFISVTNLGSGFAPHGRVTFSCFAQEKVTKEKGTPTSGPGCAGVIRFAYPPGQPSAVTSLRYVSLLPSPLQGHATKGHPWPIVALATSMSLNPLRGDSTRPPEGDFGVVCAIAA